MPYPILTPFDFWRAGFTTWCRMAEAQMAITAHCMSMAAGTAPLPEKSAERSSSKSAPITLAALRASTGRKAQAPSVIPMAAYAQGKGQARVSQAAR